MILRNSKHYYWTRFPYLLKILTNLQDRRENFCVKHFYIHKPRKMHTHVQMLKHFQMRMHRICDI